MLRLAQREPIREIGNAQFGIRLAQLCHCLLCFEKSSGKRIAYCGFAYCDEEIGSPLYRPFRPQRRILVAASQEMRACEPGICSENEWIQWTQTHTMIQVLDRHFRLTEKAS